MASGLARFTRSSTSLILGISSSQTPFRSVRLPADIRSIPLLVLSGQARSAGLCPGKSSPSPPTRDPACGLGSEKEYSRASEPCRWRQGEGCGAYTTATHTPLFFTYSPPVLPGTLSIV